MLSRVADALYWMSRYLERAEHTARLLDVHLHVMLDQPLTSTTNRWTRLRESLRLSGDCPPDGTAIMNAVTFDTEQPESIITCLTVARENARQVREQISSEMWEQINQLYLYARRTGAEPSWLARPNEFFWAVREGSHLFQGITDGTMTHSQGWHFMQIGRFIERANATSTLLGVYYKDRPEDFHHVNSADDYLEWVGLLKCCTAYEAFCKVYTADLKPDQIAEFLLLNPQFPRSVRFAADMIQAALDNIAESTETGKAGRAARLAGKLRAALSFSQIDEIMAGGLHGYLADIENQCAHIHTAVQQSYITYPIESALS